MLVLVALLVVVAAACTINEEVAPSPAASTEAPPPMSGTPSPTEASPAPTAKKIGDCAVEPKTDCSQDNLQRANLYGAKLQHSNLSAANLSHADLRKANLRKTNLKDANLSYANLESAHLQRADLTGANLNGAYMWWTNLKGAKMTGATYKGAKLCHTIRVNGTEDNSGCPKSSPSPTPSPTTSPAPTDKPTVTVLWVEHTAVCNLLGQTTAKVSVQWKTKRAMGVKIKVDGKYWDKSALPHGSEEVSLGCHASHTITLIPYNNDYGVGPSVSATVKVKGARPAPTPTHKSKPTITQLSVEHTAVCDLLGQQTESVPIRWKSKNSMGVKIKVDGSYWDKSALPHGSEQIDLGCDARHMITLTPYNNDYGDGSSVSATVKVKGGGSN
jgi:hypothetical protein